MLPASLCIALACTESAAAAAAALKSADLHCKNDNIPRHGKM